MVQQMLSKQANVHVVYSDPPKVNSSTLLEGYLSNNNHPCPEVDHTDKARCPHDGYTQTRCLACSLTTLPTSSLALGSASKQNASTDVKHEAH